MQKTHNFSAGPCILPEDVLKKASRSILNFDNNLSLIEISHRSKPFDDVMSHAKSLVKELLDVPNGYSILFLQGGASLQFTMVPYNLMKINGKGIYLNTGTWASKAIKEARKFSEVVIIEEAYNTAEYTVGILKGEALEPLEIIANDNKGFYDYQAKYVSKNTKKVEVVDKEIKKELQKIALKAFYQHGCQTWGRVDFVFNGKDFGVLEINTVPGFTENSLFPLAAKISGINYQELITRIIEDSI